MPPLSVAVGQVWRQSARLKISSKPFAGLDNGLRRHQNCPWNAMIAGDRTPLGLIPPHLRRAPRWLRKTGKTPEIPRGSGTGRLNTTHPKYWPSASLYIRGLVPPCKGALPYWNCSSYSSPVLTA